MGMFDYIKCETQLPGYSFITNEQFQTKSFDNALDYYVITANGELYREVWDYKWVTDENHYFKGYMQKVEGSYRRDYLTDIHGDIIFYNDKKLNGKNYDYFARFTDGRLTRMWSKEQDRF